MHMKKRRLFRIIAAVCLVLGILGLLFAVRAEKNAAPDETVRRLELDTGGKNRSLAYDEEKDLLIVGTHEGIVTAFRDGETVWQNAEAAGAHAALVLGASGETLYSGNEGMHIYGYRLADGEIFLDINVQRLVADIAVSPDESRIAVVTNTGQSKSNLLVYDAAGELLFNTAYKSTTLRQVAYSPDGASLLTGNKKGELRRVTEEGEELALYKTGYDILSLRDYDGQILCVCSDGSYHLLTEDFTCLRTVRINNDINASITGGAMDPATGTVFVGSEQGYLFANSAEDLPVYRETFSSRITDYLPVGDELWFTTITNGLYSLSVPAILHTEKGSSVWTVMRAASYALCGAGLVFLILGIEWLRKRVGRLLFRVWRNRMAYVFLLPTFVLLYFFAYRGIFVALTRAFTNWSKTNYHQADISFVGLDNFKTMLTDSYFRVGIKNLAILMVVNILKAVTVPLLIAWLIYNIKSDKSKFAHRFLFVFPIVIPGVINVMIWQKIYDPSTGLLNNLLGIMGMQSWQRVWLGDPKTALASIMFAGFPFVAALPMLIYYGALGNIGEEIIESALIDGAGRHKIFWKIQLPLIWPQVSLVVTLVFISTMQDYYTIYIMTAGGPGISTYVPALELYMNIAQFGKYGYASALGITLTLCTLAVLGLSRLLRKKEAE